MPAQPIQKIDLMNLSTIELKALFFDQMMIRDLAANNLAAILAEINKRLALDPIDGKQP